MSAGEQSARRRSAPLTFHAGTNTEEAEGTRPADEAGAVGGCLLDLCLRESGVTLWCFSEPACLSSTSSTPLSTTSTTTSTPLSTTSACPPGSLLLA
ncbi:unnamed protein product [Lampetra planeri]